MEGEGQATGVSVGVFRKPENRNSQTATNTQQRQVLKNLSAVLEAAGTSLDNVVKVNIFLVSMADFGAVNEVYAEFFSSDPKPVSPILRLTYRTLLL